MATARGMPHSDQASPAVVRFGETEEPRARVIQLLTETPFNAADFAEIRQVLDVLEGRARQGEKRAQREDSHNSDSGSR